MSHASDDASHHLHEARMASQAGDFVTARSHVGAAQSAGADQGLIHSALHAIDAAERNQAKSHAKQVYGFLAVTATLYLILSFLVPGRIGFWGWASLALGVAPAVIGFLFSRTLPTSTEPATRFMKSLTVVFPVVLVYGIVNIALARAKMATPITGGVVMVIVVAAFSFAVFAGVLAGFVASRVGKPKVTA